MNKYPTLDDINSYRNIDCVNQSLLKRVLSNDTRPFRESVAMIFGSAVDCMLTMPNLKDDLFYIDDIKRPSESITGFVNTLYSEGYTEIDERAVELAREANYNPNWSDEALLRNIKKDGDAYLETLIKSADKIIVTKNEWATSELTYQLTMNSPITGKYFVEQDNVDKYFQYPIYWKFGMIPCKGLIDLLIVDHETKKIYLIDIKSTQVDNIKDWFNVCKNKNYPFQMSFYKEGLEMDVKDNLKLEDYTIHCRWIVIPMMTDLLKQFKPWVINVTPEMLDSGQFGTTIQKQTWIGDKDIMTSVHKPGWLDAIIKYKQSKDQGLRDFDLLWSDMQGKMYDEDFVNDFYF